MSEMTRRSAWVTSDPSGSRRKRRPSRPETISRRPSGSQSIENGKSNSVCTTTSRLPSRSTATISCAPPVRKPETILVPARRLPHRQPAQQSPEDRATVFDQRENKTLHVVAQLSRIREAGSLVEATTIAVVTVDLNGHLFQAFFREFCQACVEQPHPDAAPLPVRQYVDSRELHRLR